MRVSQKIIVKMIEESTMTRKMISLEETKRRE